MILFAAAALALVQVTTPPQRGGSPPRMMRSDSASLLVAVRAIENSYLRAWERAWTAADRERSRTMNQIDPALITDRTLDIGAMGDPRNADRRCYFGNNIMLYPFGSFPMAPSQHSWGPPPEKRKIASHGNREHWVCPNWLPPKDFYLSGPNVADERLVPDAALREYDRRGIASLRRDAIDQLEATLTPIPKSELLVGQLVRLLVDDLDFTHARIAADDCKAIEWWCLMLRGYVRGRDKRYFEADRVFTQALAAMPAAERCRWNDFAVLLDDGDRGPYSRLTCARRDSVNARMWWLASPLWSAPGNERRVEQFVRTVLIRLHQATPRDARYDWTPAGGGDALAEMITRYGWPSFVTRGASADTVLTKPPGAPKYGYVIMYKPAPKGPPLVDPDLAQKPRGFRTTFEYSLGRTHVIPAWRLVSDPFSITNADWSLAAPAGEWDHVMNWWPREHYMPSFPLVPIGDQQTALLRRDTSALLAYATNLTRTDMNQKPADSAEIRFIVSTDPASIRTVAQRRVRLIDRVVFIEPMPRAPTMIGVEIPWDSLRHFAARSRFGVRPPPSLRDMRPGEVAISDPVLLVLPADGRALPVFADSALALMSGTTTILPTTNSIGVYWETYGFTSTDSVDVTVGVRGANASSVSWKEPRPDHTTRTIAAAVPIQMRSLVLNIETLPPGKYELEVSVRRRNDVARSVREFVVR